MRTYTELMELDTFEERYAYLKLRGTVGSETFGTERWMNQRFYTSAEWKHIRTHVIARDEGCDLGVDGYEIFGKILIHHMNPMTPDDIARGHNSIFNPEYLITTKLQTHNAIHYGDENHLPGTITIREPGDTIFW
jgi:hypothetical protein